MSRTVRPIEADDAGEFYPVGGTRGRQILMRMQRMCAALGTPMQISDTVGTVHIAEEV
jgi:hypothetical protein